MTLEGAIANAEDLVRLRRIEAAGYLDQGFAAQAAARSLAYVTRIVLLKAVFSVLPYPGPTVTTR